MGDLSEHFCTAELACKCCGVCLLDPRLVHALEELSALVAVPIHVHDGYRCVLHNQDARGVSKGAHLKGEAADITIGSMSLHEMFDAAVRVKAFKEGGVGVYDNGFIHVDVRTPSARWARVHGLYVSLAGSGLLANT